MADNSRMMKRQDYKCGSCGNVVIMANYLPDETPLPAIQCAKCKGGFGMDIQTQLYKRCGLLPVGAPTLYSIDREPEPATVQ